ncbi:MAG: omptin family outer membrane protease [Thermodesulfobacteriota bacterium]|nr:omptin family outer membrane protease [Thermodesulfobacteriota bacterium]
MKNLYWLAIIILICTAAGTVRAADLPISMDVELSLDRLEGISQYQIGGQVVTPTDSAFIRFPLSELEFPLESYLGSITLNTTIWDRLTVSMSGTANMVHADPGTMKDSDWINTSVYPDIYSESEADLDVRIWEAKLAWRLFQRAPYALYVGLGYISQDFGFDVGNTYQVSSVPGYSTGFYSGATLTYDVTYTIPYGEIRGTYAATDKTIIELSGGYSPYARAEDTDQHLLTDRMSKGDCDGYAILGAVKTRYFFTDRFSANFGMHYRYIFTEGISKTYDSVSNHWLHTIDQEIESKQASVRLGIGYEF